MEINNELIEQWEPKITRILQDKWVTGMDKADLAQELRIVIMKAAQGYKEGSAASFHTYLHRAMINRLSTLILQASRKIVPYSLDFTYSDYDDGGDDFLPSTVQEGLADPQDFAGLLELQDVLNSSGMTEAESVFLQLKLEGLTMQEIAENLGEDAYRLRANLRKRLEKIFSENREAD